MQTNELREKYLAFFETKGCVRKASDVLVPKWDPSVLFTPAGMNQFKDHFLGRCKLEFTRATTCQKCLRTGDIDNVGRTAYHHTFFEMLGNFSFGDYFKREAIHWAWEFLTDKKWLGLDPSKLSATVYKDDQEAARIWLEEIKLPSTRLQRLEEDENFWPASAPSLGPDGVCGPCSEIYHDTEAGAVEIWNLVFTQFNRVGEPPNNLQPLPSKNIDTGMGLERCAAVLQGVATNYHIDILRPLVEAAAEVLRTKYDPASDDGRRLRRIADHVRACTFAIHENVYPGNKEEKYVIRRLLRRAVLDGRQMGCKGPFLHELVTTVASLMREPYPELSETTEKVAGVIKNEEEHFIGTVDSGLDRIERIFGDMREKKQKLVPGDEIFDMYQTYGFPPELFETMAAEHNFQFDKDGFRMAMERHGELSGSSEKNLLFRHDPLESIKKTQHRSDFLGYDQLVLNTSKVVAILADGRLVDSEDEIDHSQPIRVVLDKTPFYGEKGGQIGDQGKLTGGRMVFDVETTQIDGELIVHVGHLKEGVIKVGDTVIAEVDSEFRQAVARAHSATHLLHLILRRHLGNHAEQRGSRIDADWLRFDFPNPVPVSKDVLATIEKEINRLILASSEVVNKIMELTEARKLAGAMMIFGEKYPEKVRIVQIGGSVELCGGTHCKNSSQIGLFKILSEESVSSGIRRITALTGAKAVEKMQQDAAVIQQSTGVLKIQPDEMPTRIEAMAEQIKRLQKQLKTAAAGGKIDINDLINGAQSVGDVKVILWNVPDVDKNMLRETIDQLRQKTQGVAAMLASTTGDSVVLVAGLSKDLVEKKFSAVDWVRKITPLIGGAGGGGRPDMGQGGGKDASKLQEAFLEAKKYFE